MKAKMSVEGPGREEDPKGRGSGEVGPKRKFLLKFPAQAREKSGDKSWIPRDLPSRPRHSV